MVAGLTLLAATATASLGDEVVQIYRDACLAGEFRLKPGQGAVVTAADVPAEARDSGFGAKVERATYVKLDRPATTYVVLQWFANPAPRAIRYDCTVASRNWTMKQASVAFYLDTPHASAQRMQFTNWWFIDERKEGVRKDLRQAGTNWLVLTASEYEPTKH